MKGKLKKYISFILVSLLCIPQYGYAQDTYDFYLPGYFMKRDKNAYDFVDEELIDQLKVSLQFKSDPSSGITNFGRTSHTQSSRAARHERVRQFVISYNDRFETAGRRDIAQRAVHDPDVKQVFIEVGGAISLREGEKRQRNGSNFQGIWQVYAMEQMKGGLCFNEPKVIRHLDTIYRPSVFSCAEVQEIYKLYKPLNEQERNMHTVDFFVELMGKFSGNAKSRYNNPKSPFSYWENINIWLNAIFVNKGYSKSDIEKITTAIINNEQSVLVSILSREQQILNSIGIRTPADFEKLKEYVRWGTIGTIYNGAGNNYGYYKTKRVRNVLDHQYVSNLPYQGFRFVGYRRDGGGIVWDRPDANPGVIPAILAEYPDGEQRINEFLALLIYLRKAGELKMAYHGNKY